MAAAGHAGGTATGSEGESEVIESSVTAWGVPVSREALTPFLLQVEKEERKPKCAYSTTELGLTSEERLFRPSKVIYL